MHTPTDQTYMSRALKLAEHGRHTVSPNPMVGCVIVQKGEIVGEGYHQYAGEAHAEINALRAAGSLAIGATAYVTLEPCCHHGRTPPCTDALIKGGIKKVVIATVDPNPLVSGNGMTALHNAGIEVVTGLLENEAKKLNEIFFHYITTKKPFVIAKWAMSLDGKMTTHPEDNRQISGKQSIYQVHQTRASVDAILVGATTAIADNPLLTVRAGIESTHKQPYRIIVSSTCNLPADLQVFRNTELAKTIIITTELANRNKLDYVSSKGIDIIQAHKTENDLVDLDDALMKLGKTGITSVLVEGGRKIHESFFKAGLINKVEVYLAPVIIGDMNKKIEIKDINFTTFKPDFFFSGQPQI